MQASEPAKRQPGFAVFMTGLPGAGKSTTARALKEELGALSVLPVTILDGDVVRKVLSPGLGFTKEHRDIHIQRLAFVASEIVRNGGICISAAIAPYDAARRQARSTVESSGGFVLVHVSTPLEVCESRDPKGLYARARAGTLPQFTGVCDPYEVPADADLAIDTSATTPAETARFITQHLSAQGFL